MPLTPERITQLIQQAKANPVQLPPRNNASVTGSGGLSKKAAGKTTTHNPNDVSPAMPEPQGDRSSTPSHNPDPTGSKPMPEPQGDRDPMAAAKMPARTPEQIAAANKALQDALNSGVPIPGKPMPFADLPAGHGMPGGNSGATANPTDILNTFTGATPATMPAPTNFVNNMEDFYRLTPQQRQQAVTDLQQWRPGQAPANQLVDWSGWLNAATSPTQMTDPTDSRLSKAQWDTLSRDEQINLLNPMNVVNSKSGLQDGASGQWGWGGPLQGYNYNVHDYSDMNLKEYGKQTNHADQFGSDVAGKFSTGLLNSLNEAAANDPRDAYIRDNLTQYMKDPGSLAYSSGGYQGRNAPSDPLSALGMDYDREQQIAEKKQAKKDSPPRQERSMNRYAYGSFAGPGLDQSMVNWNLPGDQYPYGPRPPAPVESGGYDSPYPPGTGTQYDGGGSVGGWGNPPTGGWGTDGNGNPILGTMPGSRPPMPQRPRGEYGTVPPGEMPPQRPYPQRPTPWNPNLPGGSQGQRPNGMPTGSTSTWPNGGFSPNVPPTPGQPPSQPVPGMPGNVPGGGQVGPPAGGIPPYNPNQTNNFQQQPRPGYDNSGRPLPQQPTLPVGLNQRPWQGNSSPVPPAPTPPSTGQVYPGAPAPPYNPQQTNNYGGAGSGQGNFRTARFGGRR